LHATLHADGGARGNPGPAGIGIVLRDDDGAVIAEVARGIGRDTNNVAEYTALITGLELALERGVTHLDVHLDSELVVQQVQGRWRIRNDRLRALAVRARELLGRYEEARVSHVPRALNEGADALANQGMDMAALDLDDGGEAGQGALLE
jgi:ribonuclease HI